MRNALEDQGLRSKVQLLIPDRSPPVVLSIEKQGMREATPLVMVPLGVLPGGCSQHSQVTLLRTVSCDCSKYPVRLSYFLLSSPFVRKFLPASRLELKAYFIKKL